MVRTVCLVYLIRFRLEFCLRFRLRLGGPGSIMGLYGPTFPATFIDFRIVYQCKLYMLHHVFRK